MKRHIVIGLFLVAALTGSASAQPTWYVDWQAPGPPNDGLTWCTAFNDLDTALGIAMPGDFILVAQGTYVPANPLTGFILMPDVAVLGGHGGCYGGFDARDIVNTPSILSGDLMLDDTPVSCTADSPDCDGLGGRCLHGLCVLPANNIENTCHVVSALGLGATAAFLDGFTITGGNADPMSIHVCTEQDGGGMLIQNSSVAVYDCIFEWNVAAGGGGGMYSYQSDPTVDGCTFERNSADFGGGMYNEEGTPGVHGSTFLRNAALTDGGGMYNDSASPDVGFCDFIENDAGQHGGGMDNYGSSPTVYNCTFSNNVAASYAAGMYNYYGSSPAITNCAFTGNVAGGLGGGMCNYLSSSPTVSNSIFTGNYGWNGGGMLNAGTSSPTLVNCTFTGNSAYTGAGGINGGGESCSATLTNCILWGDTPAEIQDGVSTTVAYSDVQGGLPTDIIDGGGNIDADPLFVDADGADDVFGTIDDDVHLQSGSPCVNTGDPNDAAYSGELDIDLQPRVQQCRVDMGADETPYLLDDCNANGLDDVECDIGGGTSTDCNGNSVPDDCETLPSGTIY
ncbi:MAG: right-handed parallel beta-helix repeat-containing protein, partial [Phycisphaerales bacterium]